MGKLSVQRNVVRQQGSLQQLLGFACQALSFYYSTLHLKLPNIRQSPDLKRWHNLLLVNQKMKEKMEFYTPFCGLAHFRIVL